MFFYVKINSKRRGGPFRLLAANCTFRPSTRGAAFRLCYQNEQQIHIYYLRGQIKGFYRIMRLPNGFGSIVNLGKKRRRPWAVRLTVGWGADKKQKFKYLSYHEKRKDALEALITYNKRPYDIDRASITFSEVFEAWAGRKFAELGASSVRNYKSIYRKCADLYDLPFRELKTAHLQAVVDANKQLAHVTLLKVLFGQLYGGKQKGTV